MIEPPVKKARSDGDQEEQPCWRLNAVLDPALVEPVPLVTVVTGRLVNRQQTSRLVRALNKLLPLPSNLGHLKRVHSSAGCIEVLLWEAETGKEDSASRLAGLTELGLNSVLEPRLGETEVAARPPRSTQQYQQLRESPRYWPTNFHPDKELDMVVSGAWQAETQAATQLLVARCRGWGGLVVRPGSTEILAKAGPDQEAHPLRHTSMLLVAEVAQVASSTAQYLLSGLEVWLWREPCHMCAMALLHSRVARLVFCVTSRDGALVTTDRLHIRQNINHRYEVFQACSDFSSGSPPFPFCE